MTHNTLPRTQQIFCTQVTRPATKWEPYFAVYDHYFHKFVNKCPTVVEVGVWQGGSLQMWREYFGAGAQIYGIDNNPHVNNHAVDGTHVVMGDQGDVNFWQQFLPTLPAIDVFVDDGGHHMHQQITTLECVWPHLSEQGVYICEDTHTSYQPFFGGTPEAHTFLAYAKDLVEVMHRNHHGGKRSPRNSHKFADLLTVHFYDSMVVLQKGRKRFDLLEVN